MRLPKMVLALAAALLAPGLLAAQTTPRMPRIGALAIFSCDRPADHPLVVGLREHGWVEGRNLEFVCVDGSDPRADLSLLAAELVALRPDVIVGNSTRVIRALKGATTSIPIVMLASGEAVSEGLIDSLAKPGGNVTGFTNLAYELAAKRLELLREIAPRTRSIAVFHRVDESPPDPAREPFLAGMVAATAAHGMELRFVRARDEAELRAALAGLGAERPDALYLLETPFYIVHRGLFAEFARAHRIVTVAGSPSFAHAGALVAYAPDVSDQIRRSAAYIDRILKGARPADLPVQQPTKFVLAINLATARALGLEVPPRLLVLADEVIE